MTAQILEEQETGVRQEVTQYKPQGPPPEESMIFLQKMSGLP